MICVIDTSALITFFELGKVELLNQLFNEVYIPVTVEEQFLKENTDEKLSFLLQFQDGNGWIKKCQTYRNDIISILNTEKKIDSGEREAIAQFKKLQEDLEIEEGRIICVIDERDARNIAQAMDVEVSGTLLLLARLHMLGFIDYYETVQPIAKRRRFSKRLIDQAFVKASEL
ncbi:MAG TPA: hypothetical protein PLJ08_00570 [Cyclobacteriaceae bacterium]|nr:hypothetical protein [Cyclobacteriaceae bacterium]